jgi:hypothetical protein
MCKKDCPMDVEFMVADTFEVRSLFILPCHFDAIHAEYRSFHFGRPFDPIWYLTRRSRKSVPRSTIFLLLKRFRRSVSSVLSSPWYLPGLCRLIYLVLYALSQPLADRRAMARRARTETRSIEPNSSLEKRSSRLALRWMLRARRTLMAPKMMFVSYVLSGRYQNQSTESSPSFHHFSSPAG